MVKGDERGGHDSRICMSMVQGVTRDNHGSRGCNSVHESRGCKRWSWLITLGRLLPSQEDMGGELVPVVASVE